ncbi:class I SAM-dependent methyltransferase [Denitrobaculum tricleocarpae]|uniref:Class I SAM-dependent methyltransferase n=1 Tax=Denitrobaculum tricleocarpae TaxID=2591009 RepID=A0A545T5N8_9PROT|nr:class I SAM-dependent methyltransferase [Denitrobaculum tricleocarpae]TQV72551.1 class I SAM-dependent methyltransferase [Denitrobaculum tricleocarpae]
MTKKTDLSKSDNPIAVEDGIVIGNVYNKYESKNPIARHLLSGFFASFDELLKLSAARDVHEVGCGEGHLSARIRAHGCKVRGSDFSVQIVEQARQLQNDDIEFTARSIYDLNSDSDSAELVVCCEVLEHLEEPKAALTKLVDVCEQWCILSVPREPIWSYMNLARGKYWSDFGNTPGHVQRWSSKAFIALVQDHFEVVEIRRPLPWTMVLCRSKDS